MINQETMGLELVRITMGEQQIQKQIIMSTRMQSEENKNKCYNNKGNWLFLAYMDNEAIKI